MFCSALQRFLMMQTLKPTNTVKVSCSFFFFFKNLHATHLAYTKSFQLHQEESKFSVQVQGSCEDRRLIGLKKKPVVVLLQGSPRNWLAPTRGCHCSCSPSPPLLRTFPHGCTSTFWLHSLVPRKAIRLAEVGAISGSINFPQTLLAD